MGVGEVVTLFQIRNGFSAPDSSLGARATIRGHDSLQNEKGWLLQFQSTAR